MEDGIKYFGVSASVQDGKCLGAFIQMSKYDVFESHLTLKECCYFVYEQEVDFSLMQQESHGPIIDLQLVS